MYWWIRNKVHAGCQTGSLRFLSYPCYLRCRAGLWARASNIFNSPLCRRLCHVIYRQITNSSEICALQSKLTKLWKWCDTWQMGIKLEKKIFLCPDRPINRYTIKDTYVQPASSYKYLGIFINFDLSWNALVEYVTDKATKKLGLLKWSLRCANLGARFLTYRSLIRLSLEYASIIWHPHYNYLSNLLESVQNWAEKFIPSSYSPKSERICAKAYLELPATCHVQKM